MTGVGKKPKIQAGARILFSIAVQTLGLSSPALQPASSSTSRAVSLQPRRPVGSHFLPQFSPTSKSNNFWEAAAWVGRGSCPSHLPLGSLPQLEPRCLGTLQSLCSFIFRRQCPFLPDVQQHTKWSQRFSYENEAGSDGREVWKTGKASVCGSVG